VNKVSMMNFPFRVVLAVTGSLRHSKCGRLRELTLQTISASLLLSISAAGIAQNWV
jgi:hypothetical protein